MATRTREQLGAFAPAGVRRFFIPPDSRAGLLGLRPTGGRFSAASQCLHSPMAPPILRALTTAGWQGHPAAFIS